MRRAASIALLLAACVGAPPAAPIDGATLAVPDVAPPPPGPIRSTLVLTAPPAAAPNEVVTFTITGAAPGQRVRLYGSLVGPGASRVCPSVFNFNCVGLLSPWILLAGNADATGTATLTGAVPGDAPLGVVSLQAFALESGATLPNRSRVGSMEIDEPPPVDTADTDPPPCADSDWWPGADLDGDGARDLRHRIALTVTGTGLSQAPIAVDVDLRAALDAGGQPGPLDPGSLRLVRQTCAGGFPVIPSQLADGLRSLAARADHVDPIGDERGALVFLYDEDGDHGTVEALPAGATATFALYFDVAPASGPRTPPAWPTDLTVLPGVTTDVGNSVTTATFDPTQGGLLDGLSHNGSGNLSSETGSCCGNSMHFWNGTTQPGPPFGWVTPQSAAGTLEVLADGPILAAVRATGERTGTTTAGVTFGRYSYDHVYWLFTRRPELYRSVTHTALIDSTTQHRDDAAYGFRPLQLRHAPQLETGVSYDTNVADRWAAVTGASYGLAVGMHQPGDFFVRINNPPGPELGLPADPRFMVFYSNEVVPGGVPSPFTVPAGETFFRDIGAVLLPYAGAFAPWQADLAAAMAGAPVAASAPETAP
jgi:hypothetical protein